MERPFAFRTPEGLGDNLWARPIVKALAKEHGTLNLITPWPQCYVDLAQQYRIDFSRPLTRLRTQAENVARWTGWSGRSSAPLFRLHYRPDAIASGGNHHDGLEACARQWLGDQVVEPRDIRLPIPSAWQNRADALLEEWSQINGPVVLIRPPTVRQEWANPARNCDPAALQVLIDELRPDHTLVGLAHLMDGAEWLTAPAPAGLHVQRYHGEVGLEVLLGLVHRAWLIGANGWTVPMALATGGAAFILFGGQLGLNAPDRLLHPGYDLSRIGYSLPDEPCIGCVDARHECSKHTDPDRLLQQFRAWRRRLSGQDGARRVARVAFAPELLLRLTHGGFRVTQNAVPPSARFVDGRFEDGTFITLVEDPSFDLVADGADPPFLAPPVIETVVSQCPVCGAESGPCDRTDGRLCVRDPGWVYGERETA